MAAQIIFAGFLCGLEDGLKINLSPRRLMMYNNYIVETVGYVANV